MPSVKAYHNIPYCDDRPERQPEPHRPNYHAVQQIRKPAQIVHKVDQRKLHLELGHEIPLGRGHLTVPSHQLPIDLLRGAKVQHRIDDHHRHHGPVRHEVVGQDPQIGTGHVVHVVTAKREEGFVVDCMVNHVGNSYSASGMYSTDSPTPVSSADILQTYAWYVLNATPYPLSVLRTLIA